MIEIDLRSIFVNYLFTFIACLIVVIFLWLQSRDRFRGMFYLVIDFCLQVLCILLISLRGHIPDFLSIDISNTLSLTGAVFGYIGLEYFIEKKSNQTHNYLLIVIFFVIHTYFTFADPNLGIRTLNLSFANLLVYAQCAWLLMKRVPKNLRSLTRYVGIIFLGFIAINTIRIFDFFTYGKFSVDYFHSAGFDVFIIISYQTLTIFLTFFLVLMINKRLLNVIAIEEEKFSKAFQSAPYAIVISRIPDGKIIEVNKGFEKLSNYTMAEVIGKTTVDLQLWSNNQNRVALFEKLKETGRVEDREIVFRKKNGELALTLLTADTITIDNEVCLISIYANQE